MTSKLNNQPLNDRLNRVSDQISPTRQNQSNALQYSRKNSKTQRSGSRKAATTMKESQTLAALPSTQHQINEFDEPPFMDGPIDSHDYFSNVANVPAGGSSRNGSSLA